MKIQCNKYHQEIDNDKLHIDAQQDANKQSQEMKLDLEKQNLKSETMWMCVFFLPEHNQTATSK